MQTGDDRDRIVERSLRTSMRELSTSASEAASMPSSSPRGKRAASICRIAVRQIEEHISSCARCQAISAAFVRANVPLSAPARSPWCPNRHHARQTWYSEHRRSSGCARGRRIQICHRLSAAALKSHTLAGWESRRRTRRADPAVRRRVRQQGDQLIEAEEQSGYPCVRMRGNGEGPWPFSWMR